MNLPNKLTMLRMFMIPVFVFFYFMTMIPYNYLLALIVFAAASITDLLDGKIARTFGIVTDFGKLMDPLADKLLVTAALCCLLPGSIFQENLGTPCLIIILSREFLVTSIRLLAASKGEVLAADIWGKLKTVVQMVWICTALLLMGLPLPITETKFLWGLFGAMFFFMMVLTIFSGVRYVVKNRHLFSDSKPA